MAQPLFRFITTQATDKYRQAGSSVAELYWVNTPGRLNNKGLQGWGYQCSDYNGYIFVYAHDLNALANSVEPELKRLEAKIDAQAAENRALQSMRGDLGALAKKCEALNSCASKDDLDALAKKFEALDSFASKDACLASRQRLQEVLDFGTSTAAKQAAEALAVAEAALEQKRQVAEGVREQFGEGKAAVLFQEVQEGAAEVKTLGEKHAEELQRDLLAQDPAIAASSTKALEAVAMAARLDAELTEAKAGIAQLTVSSDDLKAEMAKAKADRELVVECNTEVMQASKALECAERDLKTKEKLLEQAKDVFASDMVAIVSAVEAEVAASGAAVKKQRKALEQARRAAQAPELAALRAELAELKAQLSEKADAAVSEMSD